MDPFAGISGEGDRLGRVVVPEKPVYWLTLRFQGFSRVAHPRVTVMQRDGMARILFLRAVAEGVSRLMSGRAGRKGRKRSGPEGR